MSAALTKLNMTLDGRPSQVVMGPGAAGAIASFTAPTTPVFVVDAVVAAQHGGVLDALQQASGAGDEQTLILPGGEAIKTLAHLDEIYGWLATTALTRDGTLVGVGGGTILDLAGMAAATWRRGVNYVAVPTTLLAMVDAAIGGKTAINTAGLKNPVGVFHPARGILAEPALLKTLPRTEWRNGLAELIKTALIGDPELFAQLHAHQDTLRHWLADGDPTRAVPDLLSALPWEAWLARAAAVKTDVVNRDFREQGPRRALNLGHTLGHAVEAWSQHQTTPLGHGAAVAVGIAVVFQVASKRGQCPNTVTAQVLTLLRACGLPVSYPCPPTDELGRLLAGDKKAAATRGVRWVLPRQVGHMDLDGQVSVAEIQHWLDQPA